jgi:hypothetical protein
MIEVKIKEVESKGNKVPALFCNDDRSEIIYATEIIASAKKFSGVVIAPKSKLGVFSTNFSIDKYHRMENGSEVTIKIVQE